MKRPKNLKCLCGGIAKLRYGGCRVRVDNEILCIQRTPYYWCPCCDKKFLADSDSYDFEKAVERAAHEQVMISSVFNSSRSSISSNSCNKKYVRNHKEAFWHVERQD